MTNRKPQNKHCIYIQAEIWEDVVKEAELLDRSPSWVLKQAWLAVQATKPKKRKAQVQK